MGYFYDRNEKSLVIKKCRFLVENYLFLNLFYFFLQYKNGEIST